MWWRSPTAAARVDLVWSSVLALVFAFASHPPCLCGGYHLLRGRCARLSLSVLCGPRMAPSPILLRCILATLPSAGLDAFMLRHLPAPARILPRRPAHSHRRVRSAGGRSKALPTFTSGE